MIFLKYIKIKTAEIKLDQFLKWANIVSTGGQGKLLIQTGKVSVNGEKVQERGTKLKPGDKVNIEGYGSFTISGE